MPVARTLLLAALLAIISCQDCAQLPLPLPGPGFEDDARESCRASLSRIMMALDEGDGDTLRFLIYADMRVTAQQLGRDALIDCILARRSLESAARDRLADAGLASIGGVLRIIEPDARLVRAAHFEPRSEREMAGTLAPGMAPLVMRRSRDGRWRLMIRIISTLHDEPTTRTPEEGSARRIQSMNAIARATRWTAEQIRTGQIGSAEQLKIVFEKAMGDFTSDMK